MKILGIIPARGTSKGIPRKNIRLLCSKPLILYSIETALKSELLTEVMVSTEDIEIANVAKSSGARVPFMRPMELAGDEIGTIEVVYHVIKEYEYENKIFDTVCILQPTNPFRKSDLIDSAIKKFIETEADSLITVRSVPHEYNPHWVFEEKEKNMLKISTGEKNIIKRRQDLPVAYFRDGSIYLVKTNVIKEQKSLYGNKIAYLNTDKFPYINLDTMEDWYNAERLICAE